MKTISAKASEVSRRWLLIDATDKVLGRLAVEIATRLRGKHKAIFTPHVDTGDYIVVVNANKVRVTGKKTDDKMYHRYSGYPGGMKTASFAQMQSKNPERIIELAVKGMLPKGPLGRQMFRKLKIYAGQTHPHTGQQPEELPL